KGTRSGARPLFSARTGSCKGAIVDGAPWTRTKVALTHTARLRRPGAGSQPSTATEKGQAQKISTARPYHGGRVPSAGGPGAPGGRTRKARLPTAVTAPGRPAERGLMLGARWARPARDGRQRPQLEGRP